VSYPNDPWTAQGGYSEVQRNDDAAVGFTRRTGFPKVSSQLAFGPRLREPQSAVIGWQSRFRWIVTPGNDLYIVYIHNWLDDPVAGRAYTLDRRLASKILYTRRF
jgi:hypothetical protein